MKIHGFQLKDILKVIHLPESTYHYHLARKDAPNKDRVLKDLVQEIFNSSNETYGYRRIIAELKNGGYSVNHKRTQRIMKKIKIQCTKFSRKTRQYNSYKGKVGKIAKNRLVDVL